MNENIISIYVFIDDLMIKIGRKEPTSCNIYDSEVMIDMGNSDAKADKCAEIFIMNSLEGVYSHEVNRFPWFVQNIKDGYIEPDAATMGRSVYFFGRLLGTFAGAILLTSVSSRKLFTWTSVLGIIAFGVLLLIKSPLIAWGLVFIIGVAIANIFPLVFSLCVEKFPTRSNEISGLIMMAISGSTIIPLIVGGLSDISNVAIGMTVLLACWFYLFGVSVYILKRGAYA